uniref:Uncharacterized protein n=1 Tax=Noctiluca scintillans TaxID=2966 RepID=A0A7S1APL5_NOCSC
MQVQGLIRSLQAANDTIHSMQETAMHGAATDESPTRGSKAGSRSSGTFSEDLQCFEEVAREDKETPEDVNRTAALLLESRLALEQCEKSNVTLRRDLEDVHTRNRVLIEQATRQHSPNHESAEFADALKSKMVADSRAEVAESSVETLTSRLRTVEASLVQITREVESCVQKVSNLPESCKGEGDIVLRAQDAGALLKSIEEHSALLKNERTELQFDLVALRATFDAVHIELNLARAHSSQMEEASQVAISRAELAESSAAILNTRSTELQLDLDVTKHGLDAVKAELHFARAHSSQLEEASQVAESRVETLTSRVRTIESMLVEITQEVELCVQNVSSLPQSCRGKEGDIVSRAQDAGAILKSLQKDMEAKGRIDVSSESKQRAAKTRFDAPRVELNNAAPDNSEWKAAAQVAVSRAEIAEANVNILSSRVRILESQLASMIDGVESCIQKVSTLPNVVSEEVDIVLRAHDAEELLRRFQDGMRSSGRLGDAAHTETQEKLDATLAELSFAKFELLAGKNTCSQLEEASQVAMSRAEVVQGQVEILSRRVEAAESLLGRITQEIETSAVGLDPQLCKSGETDVLSRAENAEILMARLREHAEGIWKAFVDGQALAKQQREEIEASREATIECRAVLQQELEAAAIKQSRLEEESKVAASRAASAEVKVDVLSRRVEDADSILVRITQEVERGSRSLGFTLKRHANGDDVLTRAEDAEMLLSRFREEADRKMKALVDVEALARQQNADIEETREATRESRALAQALREELDATRATHSKLEEESQMAVARAEAAELQVRTLTSRVEVGESLHARLTQEVESSAAGEEPESNRKALAQTFTGELKSDTESQRNARDLSQSLREQLARAFRPTVSDTPWTTPPNASDEAGSALCKGETEATQDAIQSLRFQSRMLQEDTLQLHNQLKGLQAATTLPIKRSPRSLTPQRGTPPASPGPFHCAFLKSLQRVQDPDSHFKRIENTSESAPESASSSLNHFPASRNPPSELRQGFKGRSSLQSGSKPTSLHVSPRDSVSRSPSYVGLLKSRPTGTRSPSPAGSTSTSQTPDPARALLKRPVSHAGASFGDGSPVTPILHLAQPSKPATPSNKNVPTTPSSRARVNGPLGDKSVSVLWPAAVGTVRRAP